jgi:hypothetical protein
MGPHWEWDWEQKKMNRKQDRSNYSKAVKPGKTDKGFVIPLDDTPIAISRSLVFDNNGEMWIHEPGDDPGFGFV